MFSYLFQPETVLFDQHSLFSVETFGDTESHPQIEVSSYYYEVNNPASRVFEGVNLSTTDRYRDVERCTGPLSSLTMRYNKYLNCNFTISCSTVRGHR